MLQKLFNTNYHHPDLIRVFISAIPISILGGNIVMPILISYLFYDSFHIIVIAVWLSAHFFLFLSRLYLRTKLLKVFDSKNKSQWEYSLKWYMVMVSLTAVLWGIFAVLGILYTSDQYLIIILFILLGLSGTSFMTLGSIPYLFNIFNTLILLPLSIGLFYMGSEIHYMLSIWVLLYYVAIVKGNTRYYGVFSNAIQLNENLQKQQAKLIEHKTRYELIFNKALDGVLILEDGKFVDCNESIVKMLKYKHKEEILNTHPSMLSPKKQPDGRLSSDKAEEMMNLAYKHKGHQFEWVHTKATGEDFWCEIVLTPIFINEKEILHVVWRDISARKKIEDEYDILNEQMEMAFSGNGDGLWDWNILDDTAYLSPRWKSMLGYEDHELDNVLSSWEERVHPDDLKEVFKCIELSMSGEVKVFENIHRIRHKEGHWVWIYDRGRTIFDENDKPVRMIGTHTDLSREMSLRTELEVLNKTLEIKIEEAVSDLKKSQQQAKLGSWKLDILTNTLTWSDVTYEIFELPKNDKIATYENFLNTIHPDDRDKVNDAYALSLK
ncbi:MAG: PAS domain-containing protein, partial [Bacteroidales bacterium]|nr:PAS domain-containing protein [Bacteroidales bacterium]